MTLRSPDPALYDAATTLAVGGAAADVQRALDFAARSALAPTDPGDASVDEGVIRAVVLLVLAAMRAQHAVDRARARGESLPGDDLDPTEIEPLGGQGTES